jgi:hypothetical protein
LLPCTSFPSFHVHALGHPIPALHAFPSPLPQPDSPPARVAAATFVGFAAFASLPIAVFRAVLALLAQPGAVQVAGLALPAALERAPLASATAAAVVVGLTAIFFLR